ncbi:MAG: type VI secretion system baseplate subunit TssK [Ferruginibacter sp.]
MRDNRKHFPVNWIDGMKINKSHFIDQDNAWTDALQDMAALNLSPLRYGVLPSSLAGENTFNIKMSIDNQESIRVSVISCYAITSGGARLSLPSVSAVGQAETGNILTSTFPSPSSNTESAWWIFLLVHPYEKQPAGSPDLSENPPRFPIVLPSYTLQLVSESNYREFANHPFALAVGKIYVNGRDIQLDHEYIPPCFSVNAHPDLVSLHGELDKYLSDLELFCSQIVQKIFKKSQQNDISELVLFLCDRVMLFLGQAITAMRWTLLYEPPAIMFASISTLARVMKNTIDLRTGSGKDELMNYLTEWCELKQGELESMLSNLANTAYSNNDINKNIQKIAIFVKVTRRLFETLSKLEFIGKRKESGIFVKEESVAQSESQIKAKRRFFG